MDYIKTVGIGYVIIINLIGFFAMGLDKRKARKHKWRIKEATLFLFAIIGGSIGCWLGMYVFHHKTKHWYFVVGMPVILALQVIAVVLIGMKLSFFALQPVISYISLVSQ